MNSERGQKPRSSRADSCRSRQSCWRLLEWAGWGRTLRTRHKIPQTPDSSNNDIITLSHPNPKWLWIPEWKQNRQLLVVNLVDFIRLCCRPSLPFKEHFDIDTILIVKSTNDGNNLSQRCFGTWASYYLTILYDELYISYDRLYKGSRQKLLSAFFPLRGYPLPPPP